MNSAAREDANTGNTRKIIVLVLIALLSLGGILWYGNQQKPYHELVADARDAIAQKNYAEALEFSKQALKQNPAGSEAALLAGQASAGLEEYETALDFFNKIPDNGGLFAVDARLAAGNILFLKLNRSEAALEQYQRALKQDPENIMVNFRLAYLLGLTGQTVAAIPYRLKLLQLEQPDPILMYLIAWGISTLENVEDLAAMNKNSPDDPLLKIGLARQAIDQQKPERAEELLTQAIEKQPDNLAAQFLLGGLLLESNQQDAFLKWHKALPADAEQQAPLWGLRGKWAAGQSNSESAIRCYWEAVKRDPNDQHALYQLGQLLVAAGKNEQADLFLKRVKDIQRYNTYVKDASSSMDLISMHDAAKLAESLGLMWEAYGWALLATKKESRLAWAVDARRRLKFDLADMPLVRTAEEFNPALKVDLASYPLPEITLPDGRLTNPGDSTNNQSRSAQIHFVDKAKQAGIEFQYFNGAPRDKQTRRMYEFNGGGVGVLDYDYDGWPDLHLTQGSAWPNDQKQTDHLDRLYRNLGDGTFVDVTAQSGLQENGYSAGVTVGDYDNDGFPDLYIANIGANRFYHNNGDGTFTDITNQTNTAGDAWSTSCLLADLNDDQLPDLYVVNYLQDNDLFTRICPDEDGNPRSCIPANFAAARDELYQNNGNGEFVKISQAAGIDKPNGKGLGIVAADFSNQGFLDLFIANDAVPNFYFVNNSSTGKCLFNEHALISGLALNQAGLPEACMGIAIGDVDGNRQLDLFVTNFYNESNTLYLNQSAGQFQDHTSESKLHIPSLKMLGFGTQFLDSDLDGDLDIIATNGHIDDLRHKGEMYQMPPQYFRNEGTGRYQELSAASLGAYFEGRYLGRGLARLDWNRDGKPDVIITHLDAPVALLTNQSDESGQSLTLKLTGVSSSRDAIGTHVSAQIGKQIVYRQLTAGDGFQVSNQRQIIIGTGTSDFVEELHITWPSGQQQKFNQVPANKELHVIEGEPNYHLLSER